MGGSADRDELIRPEGVAVHGEGFMIFARTSALTAVQDSLFLRCQGHGGNVIAHDSGPFRLSGRSGRKAAFRYVPNGRNGERGALQAEGEGIRRTHRLVYLPDMEAVADVIDFIRRVQPLRFEVQRIVRDGRRPRSPPDRRAGFLPFLHPELRGEGIFYVFGKDGMPSHIRVGHGRRDVAHHLYPCLFQNRSPGCS